LADVFEEETQDEEISLSLNRDTLKSFSELIQEKEVQKVVTTAKQMQKQWCQI
jgi:hypothetical protein